MYCNNCGMEVPDHAVFCTECGTKISENVESNGNSQESQQAINSVNMDNYINDTNNSVVGVAEVKNGKKLTKGKIIAIVGGVAATLAIGIISCVLIFGGKDYNKVATSDKERDEVVVSQTVSDEAVLTDNEIGVELDNVLSYLKSGNYSSSKDLLLSLNVDSNSMYAERYLQLNDIINLELVLEPEFDVSDFPLVVLNFGCKKSDIKIDKSNITIVDEGTIMVVKDVVQTDTALKVSFDVFEDMEGVTNRNIVVKLKLNDTELEFDTVYTPPVLEQANIQIVSTDVSDYPRIKLYVRIEDAASEESIAGLTNESLVIREIEGGEYLAREVNALEQLKGNEGLSIDLLADKSASMTEDIYQVKEVMQEFVNSLDFSKGDQVEIIAFDSYVMYMCTYTNDSTLLENGINNMSTYGQTALYDALMCGIKDASYQTGARCVIAFTDGLDIVSNSSEFDVINEAIQNSVPVYIIGTGGADETVLKNIADSTGGYYWNIDNLNDMNDILQKIYVEQKDMYCIEYITDENIDQYKDREVNIILADKGYGENFRDTFTPVVTLKSTNHTSRYELIMDDISWEEANQKCIEMGGHLATITSESEMVTIEELAENNGAKYVWLGGYTSVNGEYVYGHWVTGEPFDFTAWYTDEPSRNDMDGTPEMYIMLWKINEEWSWNDQRNDLIKDTGLDYFKGKIAYVCEYVN